jgi:hypothetical protein
MNGNLDEPGTGILQLADELDTNDARVMLQRDLLQHGTSNEAEIAVHVAYLQAEHDPCHFPVNCSEQHPVPRIVACDFVALHYIDAIIDERQ